MSRAIIFLHRWKAYYFIVLLIPFLLFLKPVLTKQFVIGDDHEIIRFKTGQLNLIQALDKDRLYWGRFRPFYWLVRVTQYHIFGTDPIKWHLLNFLLVITISVLIFSVLYLLGIHPLLSVFASWFSVLNLSAVDSWLLLGPQELLATFLLLLVVILLFIPKRNWIIDILTLFLTVLMVLTKENYALLLPSLIIVKNFLGKNRKSHKLSGISIIKTYYLSCLLGLIMLSSICYSFFVAKRSGFHTNGGTILRTYSSMNFHLIFDNAKGFLKVIENSIMYKKLTLFFSFIFLFVFLINKTVRKLVIRKRYEIGVSTVALFFWLFGQLAIYSGRSYTSSHYPLPFIIGLVFWFFYIINFPFSKLKNFPKLITIVVLILILNKILNPSIYSTYSYMQNSHRLSSIISSIESKIQNGGSIIIIGHPSYDVERAPAMMWFLQGIGKNFKYYYLPSDLVIQQKDIDKDPKISNEFIDMDARCYFPSSVITLNQLPVVKQRLAIVAVSRSDVTDQVIKKYKSCCNVSEVNINNKIEGDWLTSFFNISSFYQDNYWLYFVENNSYSAFFRN